MLGIIPHCRSYLNFVKTFIEKIFFELFYRNLSLSISVVWTVSSSAVLRCFDNFEFLTYRKITFGYLLLQAIALPSLFHQGLYET